jgi:hypothetical protein
VIDTQFAEIIGAATPTHSTKVLRGDEILALTFDKFFQDDELLSIKMLTAAAT